MFEAIKQIVVVISISNVLLSSGNLPRAIAKVTSSKATAPAKLQVQKTGMSLKITAQVPEGVTEVELRFQSNRNRQVSKFRDISPLNPEPERVKQQHLKDAEIWYPVVDMFLEPGMEGVATFDSAPKLFAANHMFYPETQVSNTQIVVPFDKLELWENTVFVEPAAPKMKSFYLRQKLSIKHGQLHRIFKSLSSQWSGTISLYDVSGNESHELQRVELKDESQASQPVAANVSTLDRERLLESLRATVAFTLRAQNTDPVSPTYGGLYLFYDHDARLFRTSYWVWGWGPSVKLLLDSAKIQAVASSFEPGKLVTTAAQIGQAGLRFQIKQHNHPADGSVLVRWDRGLNMNYGHRKCLSTSDGNFLSGWAWVPLSETAGVKNREEYLNAAKTLAMTTGRLMNEFEIIPQDYYDDLKTWADHTLDESGFGMEGLAALYHVTGDKQYQKIGERYIEQHLAKLEQEDGLWGRRWLHLTNRREPNAYHTRGQGWAMEGLLAAHKLQPNGRYLTKAERMAEHLMRWQHPSGYWSYPLVLST